MDGGVVEVDVAAVAAVVLIVVAVVVVENPLEGRSH